MRLSAVLFALVALAACASYAGSDRLFTSATRQQQVVRDTVAILQGMAQAHAANAESAACNAATQTSNERSPCR